MGADLAISPEERSFFDHEEADVLLEAVSAWWAIRI